ncbi:FAD/NAD(P)-binding oxidoreductase [Actinidia rufa]|uniref:FAD/NAD(P)-binding oxidoreductase n=1 Tax=Actinidia rufa TaxID=165716 RepID=A0A7J0HEJ3_9ERIC|nr:FAD/NAD(P)-binding oxidoreductase [Actinidia rufa]
MSTTLSPSSLSFLPLSLSHASPHHRPVVFRRSRSRSRSRLLSIAASIRQDTVTWTSAPLAGVLPAADSLFQITVDVSDSPELAASHVRAGQYLQLRLPDAEKPSFLAVASPPSLAAKKGVFEFLVKSVAGSTAELLCGLGKGDVVELTQVMGRGFDVDQISPAEEYSTVLIFATGSGISPIRSLIESGFSANKRPDVRLYYGLETFKEWHIRFKNWESSGIKIIPVLSQSDDKWTGECGYVQAAFARAKKLYSPQATGAVLCGQKQMYETKKLKRENGKSRK